jgi:hypothetical protein
MEIALLIHRPVSSATLRYLRAPMIVGARNRDCKCENNRHDHSAKYPTEEGELHFNSFRSLMIEAHLRTGLPLKRDLMGSGAVEAFVLKRRSIKFGG